MSGMMKLVIAAAGVLVALGILVILAAGALERGRMSYCRNNLRKLGEMGGPMIDPSNPESEKGRAFWQSVRRQHYSNERKGVLTWVIRQRGENPFACPVRGEQPLELLDYSPEQLDRLMSDPNTIDYRGPTHPPAPWAEKLAAIGGDREGNHGDGRAHVLLADLTVHTLRDSIRIERVRDDGEMKTKLVD